MCVYIKYAKVNQNADEDVAQKVADKAAALRKDAAGTLPAGGSWEDLSVVGWYFLRNGQREDIRLVNGQFANVFTGETYADFASAASAASAHEGVKPFFSAGSAYWVGERDVTSNAAVNVPPSVVPTTSKAAKSDSESEAGPMNTIFGQDEDW